MIRFQCSSCYKPLKVSEAQAGRQGRCPGCGQRTPVPGVPTETDSPIPVTGLHLRREPLEPPPPGPRLEEPPVEPVNDEPPAPGRRRYPVVLDVLLYPTSTAGVITLVVFWLLPFGVSLLGFLRWFAFIFNLLLGAYFFTYLANAVRDSAEGGTRAPENMSDTTDIWEAIGQALYLWATVALFALPAFGVYMWRGPDVVFWVVAGAGALLLPMAMLSTVILNSISIFFPWLWIGSIASTLAPYLGLLLLIYLPMVPWYFLPASRTAQFLAMPIQVYQMLIYAHLLGRFFFRYEERLNWEA